jgi:hypothetical protein
LCASLINLSRDRECYDDPMMDPISFPNDDIGVCIFKNCRNNGECTPPLTCERRTMTQQVCTLAP